MKSHRVVIYFIMVFFLLSGCASKSLPKIEAHYYQQCIRPLIKMQESNSQVARQTATGALGGALAGAVVGIIASGRLEGALIGLAAGAVSGTAIGYTFAKLDQIADENTRFASIRITANQDLSKANRLQLYSYECIDCYMREFDGLQAGYESGRITKDEYAKRFSEIRNAMVELGKVIGNMDAEIARTEREFNTSLSRSVVGITSASNPMLTSAAKGRQGQPRKRPKALISDTLAEKHARVEQAQEKNDTDLTAMLDDFAGKVHPPKQDARAIEQNYGRSYAEAREQIEELRSLHREVITIMDEAAIEAGIDMV